MRYLDKSGVEFKEFDVVKVFHFTGARNKKHYMYKWIRKDATGRMCFQHLDEESSSLVWLSIACNSTLKGSVWLDAEIVQSY